MSERAERHEFQAEVRELLDLMIHSLYSHKDIFLRELISNASDALDKIRFEALSRPELASRELEITLEVDAAARTLAVHDHGIGMSRSEVVENLGTIARSGTREFLRAIREAKAAAAPELIGQFGVGFYASFMVADRITVVTRRAGTEEATLWESTGDGSYTIGPAERPAAGTTVTLHLKPQDEEDGLNDYTKAGVLKDIVKRYSDFVTYPIRLQGETLNSMKAIWARDRDAVTEDEHREFYKHISHDWNDPLEHLSVHMEGSFEARALLYIPSKAPFDLHDRDGGHRGLSLYVKRVFIMDDWRELLPPHLRFVRGVVSSDDLSLNVSREILQKDRQIQAIRKYLVRRLHAALREMKEQRAERYRTFWAEFGAVLKEGLLGIDEEPDRLLELVLAASTDSPALSSLGEYVTRMKSGQPAIYYLTAASREAAERSPHLEAVRARGYEVLFFLDPIDELWLRMRREFEGKPLMSVSQGGVDLGSGEDAKTEGAVPEEVARGLQGSAPVAAGRAAGRGQGRAAVGAPDLVPGLPGRRAGRSQRAHRGAAAPERARGAEGEAGARGQSVAPAADPAARLPRRPRGRRALPALRHAAARTGHPGRGGYAARPRRVQPPAGRALGGGGRGPVKGA